MGFEINQVVITGNLTRDPELRSTKGGTSVCSMRIAHNERVKQDGEWTSRANFFDVTVWEGVGEWCARELRKGMRVTFSGKLKWREWEDANGNKRQTVDITAYDVVPERGDGDAPRSSGGGGASRSAPPQSDVPGADAGEFLPVGGGDVPTSGGTDDDIPF
jgi:single-strand DNA-binding protein